MSYPIRFSGQFAITPPLQHPHWVYLRAFAKVRHVRRDAAQAEQVRDEARTAVGLPIGEEGGYCVASEWSSASLLDANYPPSGQPSLYCQWMPNEQGTALVWDQGESFYDSVEWLEYLIRHFLARWGYVLAGTVTWQGREVEERGTITVEDNQTVGGNRSATTQQPAPTQPSDMPQPHPPAGSTAAEWRESDFGYAAKVRRGTPAFEAAMEHLGTTLLELLDAARKDDLQAMLLLADVVSSSIHDRVVAIAQQPNENLEGANQPEAPIPLVTSEEGASISVLTEPLPFRIIQRQQEEQGAVSGVLALDVGELVERLGPEQGLEFYYDLSKRLTGSYQLQKPTLRVVGVGGKTTVYVEVSGDASLVVEGLFDNDSSLREPC